MAKVINFDERQSNVHWEEALQEFLFWKQAQGLSQTTLEDYKRYANMFFKRFPGSWQSDAFRKSVLEYMADDIKPATYNLRLIYLRAFFQWCVNEGYLPTNPLKDFKRKKAPGRVVDIAEDTLQKLLTLPDQTNFAGLRDYALILLTLDTGIRPKEAFSLIIDNYDLKRLLVTVPMEVAKTRTERHLPILPTTAQALRKLISVRHPEWKNDVPIFCTSEGETMNRHSWNDRMKLYSNQLETKIRPYDLRHSFALMYLRNGGHAFGLQNTLGHTDIQMTKKYVNLTGQDLRSSHTAASPLNTLIPQKKKTRIRKINVD